jgi:outer membrane biosynthesis protein TonB
MDRIDRLERSWIIYKSKKFFKSAAFFGVALIAGAVVVYFLLRGVAATDEPSAIAQTANDQTIVIAEPKPMPTTTTPPQTPPAPIETPQAKPPVQTQSARAKPKMSIAPNYDFAYEVDRRLAESIAASRNQPQVTPSQSAAQTIAAQPERSSTSVSFQRVGGIKELEDAFNKQPSYSKAADIAEHYLKQNNYQRA